MQGVFELNVIDTNIDCVTSTVIVDVPETMSRYEVHLSFFPKNYNYLLTISNFRNITVHNHSKYGNPDFRYQLLDAGLSKVDAQAIQQIISELSLKEIERKSKRNY